MTCIVGIAKGGKVFMGGDSAAVGGWDLTIRSDRKVFVNDGYLMGFTTSFRMGQLLQYALKPPHPAPKTDLMLFMVTEFADAVRHCLKAGGFATKQSDAEEGGHFLVGYRGRLFHIQGDYQIAESAHGFDAVGCGNNAALGALHATPKMEPKKRVLVALQAAEQCSAGVRAPFHILSIAGEKPAKPTKQLNG